MEVEVAGKLLGALAELARLSRHAGLSRASEALDDAVILVFNGLCADGNARTATIVEVAPGSFERLH